MKRARLTRMCEAAPPITVAVITVTNGYANLAGNDQAFGAAQIATAAFIVALAVYQARETQ